MREEIERFMSSTPCPACNGYPAEAARRWPSRSAGCTSARSRELSIRRADDGSPHCPPRSTPSRTRSRSRILKEIRERLRFLNDVGLDYLTLSRNSGTLSGGESQRIRLASQIGSGLTGVLYVLDEPSIGLHQRDNARLLETLMHLRDLGNTVIVVEHDEDAILHADYVVDIGPAAGIHGGQVIAQGTPREIMANPASITGQYLSGALEIADARLAAQAEERAPHQGRRRARQQSARTSRPRSRSAPSPASPASRAAASRPCSSRRCSRPRRAASWARASTRPSMTASRGLEFLDKVIDIDQSPIGRTPRSNPATYTGAFTPIRDWFAGLPEAKARGYQPGRFSFNVKGGRCEACQGDGVIKIEMHFLPDVYVTCDVCHGKRYNRETLEVTFKGKSIADVLDMTVEEGVEFFAAVPGRPRQAGDARTRSAWAISISASRRRRCRAAKRSAIKLAKELSRKATGNTLYILDEPTTGLHFHDVAKLLEVLHELVDQGNTVVVIEHNLEVIKTADWILDLGPEGGDGGGELVAAGRPEDIMREPRSYTGQFLKELLERRPRGKREAAE